MLKNQLPDIYLRKAKLTATQDSAMNIFYFEIKLKERLYKLNFLKIQIRTIRFETKQIIYPSGLFALESLEICVK